MSAITAADIVNVDLTVEAVGGQWVSSVEQTSRQLIDDLGRALTSGTDPVIVITKVDATSSAVQNAARHAVKGVVGVAALEQAPVGRRVNAVTVTTATATDDLTAVTRFLADNSGAATCTGATVDLTNAAAVEPAQAGLPVLVTGASGGLGRAAAAALHSAGYPVILSDLDTPALQQAAETLGVEAIPCNVVDHEDVARLAAHPRVAGGLAGLAVYHGVGGAGALGEIGAQTRDRSLVINGTGVYNVVDGLVPALIRGQGAVVVLASQAGLISEVGGAAYCASKFAAVGYVEALAQQLASTGVRVHSICPGPVDTPLMRESFAGMAAAQGMTFEQYYQSRLDEIPLRRFGSADQIALAAPLLIRLRATGVVLSATAGVVLT